MGALLVEFNEELIAAPRRYMAAVTLEPLLDRPNDQIPSIPAVTN